MGILDGKVAIVTGASKGIGVGEAIAIAKEGAKVAVLARTFDGDESVVATAKKIEAIGGEALPLQCDVCILDQVNQAVASVIDAWGTVDILVNNAQMIYEEHPLEEWTESEMRATWESGLLASWAFMVACFPYMKEKGWGRVINTCSGTGHGNIPGFGGYATTKEAIRGLTRNSAREWGKHGINVNAICPAAMSDAVRKLFPDEESLFEMVRRAGFVIPRVGDAEKDIGRAVVYLSGPDSDMITGCLLSVDGGSAML